MTGREWAIWRFFPMQREPIPPAEPSTATRREDGKECDVLATIGIRAPRGEIDPMDTVTWEPV